MLDSSDRRAPSSPRDNGFAFFAPIPRFPMHIVFVLDRLLALAQDGALPPASPLPGIARILADAGASVPEPEGIAAALALLYGIERQTDWPVASIRLAALGVDPGSAYWLAADPVAFTQGREDSRVAAVVTDLSAKESAAIVATLNDHFAGDALAFIAPRPDAWFVRAPSRPALATRALDVAVGREMRKHLPSGADAGTWWRWQEETQMLLFAHEVNAQRERSGLTGVNGIWLSSGGTLPARHASAPPIVTIARGGVAKALAAHVGAPAISAGEDDTMANFIAKSTDLLVVAPDPMDDLGAIDHHYALPAARMLSRGAVDRITVIAGGNGTAVRWTARRRGRFARIFPRFERVDIRELLATATR